MTLNNKLCVCCREIEAQVQDLREVCKTSAAGRAVLSMTPDSGVLQPMQPVLAQETPISLDGGQQP